MKKFKAPVTLVGVGLGENSAEFDINHTNFMTLDLIGLIPIIIKMYYTTMSVDMYNYSDHFQKCILIFVKKIPKMHFDKQTHTLRLNFYLNIIRTFS